MKITFFHWSKSNAPSIVRSFVPYINELKKNNDVKEYYVPYAGSSPLNILKNIIFIYKHRSYDGVNHITGDIHYGVLGLIRCKSVLTIHDDYAFIKARKGYFGKLYKWFLWLYLPITFSDKVVCISDATKAKIDRLVSNNKTVVLTHHCLSEGFEYYPKIFDKNCPTILQVGATIQKNLNTTIKSLHGVNCKLRVVKIMTEEQHILAKKLGLNYHNVFDLTNDEILAEFKNADIVVFPSLYEGFGMPIIEAQAIGRPIITSNISPMNWVAGGGAILLNDPLNINEYKEAINKIIEDDKFREELVLLGLKNSLRFNTLNVTMNYVELYKELI